MNGMMRALGMGVLACGVWTQAPLASVAAGKPPAAAAKARATTAATITFDGGNAFVFNDSNWRVDAGAIAGDGSSAYNAHHMYLVLEQGTAGDYSPYGSMPAPRMIGGRPAWPLQGFDVWPCADGSCPTTSNLETPSSSISNEPCGSGSNDSLYYLPDMLDQSVYPGAALEKDWCQQLESRMVLKAGTLQVTSASDCFEFVAPDGVKWRQKLAHEQAEIRYQIPIDRELVVYFKGPTKPCLVDSGQINGAISFKPDAQGLRLRVRSDATSYGPVSAGDEIKHFQQFYELVELNGAKRNKIYYQFTRSPGSECPAARFGGPAVAAPTTREGSPKN